MNSVLDLTPDQIRQLDPSTLTKDQARQLEKKLLPPQWTREGKEWDRVLFAVEELEHRGEGMQWDDKEVARVARLSVTKTKKILAALCEKGLYKG